MGLVRNANGSRKHFQEVVGRGKVDGEIEFAEDKLLHCNDLVLGTGIVSHVDEVFNCWRVDFLVLGGDYHGCNPKQLHFIATYFSAGQEPIGEVDCDVECFRLQFEAYVHINEPVDEDHAHVFVYFFLVFHVGRLWIKLRFLPTTPKVNVICVLEPVERNFH